MYFDYFWYTKDNIPDGVGFKLFGLLHVTELVLAALIIIGLAMLFKRLNQQGRGKMLVIIGVLLVIDELVKDIGTAAVGLWDVGYLPLHICSISLILSVIYLFTKSKTIAQIIYCLGVPGACIALITPSWTTLPAYNFMHLHSYTVHILLILFPILLVINGERPSFRYFKGAYAAVLIYCVPTYFLNKLWNTDFVFLNGARDTPFEFLPDVLGDPWYIFPCALILGLLMVLMILPWHIIDNRKTKPNKS